MRFYYEKYLCFSRLIRYLFKQFYWLIINKNLNQRIIAKLKDIFKDIVASFYRNIHLNL